MTELASELASVSATSLSLDALADLLDGLLDTGISVVGDLIISVAGVDLVRVDLRALVAGVEASA